MTLLYKKGYHLEVTSWENDADNFQTHTLFVGSNEETARGLLKLCSVCFASKSNGGKGIGNMMSDDYMKAAKIVANHLEENPDMYSSIKDYFISEDIDLDNLGDVWDTVCCEFGLEIMGNSEWYAMRVFEKGKVMHFQEDLFVDVIDKL